MGIADNLVHIQNRIRIAAAKAGRNPDEIQLVAVTKYTSVDRINEAMGCGVTDIGENRVQDAHAKMLLISGPVKKHLIGSLQTNKAKTAVELFDLIHSVDRPALVAALHRSAKALSRQVEILIQVNVSGESTKHGAAPEDVDALLKHVLMHPGLIPAGLMTIAPMTDDPETCRPVFRCLRELFVHLKQTHQLGEAWQYLSMGMSQDFEVAIEEGANLIRIGTAIFKTE